ncbi:hypothetical protein MTR67_010218, partial [Solanum verrucosum]
LALAHDLPLQLDDDELGETEVYALIGNDDKQKRTFEAQCMDTGRTGVERIDKVSRTVGKQTGLWLAKAFEVSDNCCNGLPRWAFRRPSFMVTYQVLTRWLMTSLSITQNLKTAYDVISYKHKPRLQTALELLNATKEVEGLLARKDLHNPFRVAIYSTRFEISNLRYKSWAFDNSVRF